MATEAHTPSSGALLGLSLRMQNATSWMFKRVDQPSPSVASPSIPESSPTSHTNPSQGIRTCSESEGDHSAEKAMTRCESFSDSDSSTSSSGIVRSSSVSSTDSSLSNTSGHSATSTVSLQEALLEEEAESLTENEASPTEPQETLHCPSSPRVGDAGHSSSPFSQQEKGEEQHPHSTEAATGAAAGKSNEATNMSSPNKEVGAEMVREFSLEMDDRKLREEISRRLEKYRVSHDEFKKGVVRLMSSQECLQAAAEKFKARAEIASRLATHKA